MTTRKRKRLTYAHDKVKTIKIQMKDDDRYCIVDKRTAILLFDSVEEDVRRTNIEVVLPNKEDLGDTEISNSINLATAIALRLKLEPAFGDEMLTWFAAHIEKVMADSTVVEN